MSELDRFIELSEGLSDPTETPKLILRAKAIQRVLRGETVEQVSEDAGLGRHFLRVWVEAVQKDGFYGWLGKPEPKPEKVQRARGSIAQMLLGLLAEEHFASLAHDALGLLCLAGGYFRSRD